MKPKSTLRSFLSIASSAVLTISYAHAANLTWDAGGGGGAITNGGGAWLAAGLWNDATVAATWTSGDDAIFAGPATAGGAVTLASPTTVNSLTFGPSFTGTYTLGTAGQAITLNTGITKNAGSGIATIISPIILGGTQSWTNNATTDLTISAATDLNSNALTIGGTGTKNMSATAAVISGAGGLTANGGRLWLGAGGTSPVHTYSGDTNLSGGAVVMFNSNLSANSNVNINGGVLESYWTGGLTRALGTGATQLRITGGESGFAMNGSNGATFNSGASITWGDVNFSPSKFLLQTQYSQGTSALTFSSAINLNGANRTIVAHQGASGNASSTLSGNISGTGAGLIKEGAGLLNLTGTNIYDGGTTISAGILKIANTVSMPSSGNVTVNSGATLAVDVTGTGNFTSATSGAGSFGGILSGVGVGTSTVTYSGDVTVGIDISGGATTYSGVIANPVGSTSLSLRKINGQNLTLTGANTYSGKTILGGGSVVVASFGNVADASSPLGTNSTIEFLAGGNLSFTGTTAESSDKIINIAQTDATLRADGTGAGAITLTANINPTSTSNKTLSLFGANTNANTISGNISNGAGGTLGVTKNLAGTWVLSGNNSYTGTTTVTAGTLEISGTNTTTGVTTMGAVATAIFKGSAAMGSGTLQVSGSGTAVGTFRIQQDGGFSKSNGLQCFNSGATMNLVVDRQTAGSGAASNYQFTGVAGAGNDFSSGTKVNFSAGANITSGTPTVTITNGVRSQDSSSSGNITIDASGVNLSIGGLTVGGAASKGRTWILKGTSTGNAVTGAIVNNTTAVTKEGAGTWTLSGANTYGGATTITAGTLAMGANNVLPTSAVSIGNATLDADTRTDTVGTLDVTGTAVINLGTGAALAFAKSDAIDWTGGTLNVTGTLGATSLRFGDSLNQPGLTSTQLALISVNGAGTGTYVLDADGYLVAGGGGSPEIDVNQGGDIANGGSKNFGNVTLGSNTSLIFAINNTGTAALNLNGTPPDYVAVTETAGGLVLNFDMLDSANRGTATLSVEHSNDLGIGDPWEAAAVPGSSSTVNDVVFAITGSGTLDVTATIPVSKAAAGKLFGRLKATE